MQYSTVQYRKLLLLLLLLLLSVVVFLPLGWEDGREDNNGSSSSRVMANWKWDGHCTALHCNVRQVAITGRSIGWPWNKTNGTFFIRHNTAAAAAAAAAAMAAGS